ncbi:hypothetical protein IFVP69_C180432 [Vibrio parahaemolyticus]
MYLSNGTYGYHSIFDTFIHTFLIYQQDYFAPLFAYITLRQNPCLISEI